MLIIKKRKKYYVIVRHMKIVKEKEEFLNLSIRNAIAVNPLVSIREMQKIVSHNLGRSISDKYLASLMQKMRRRAIIQSDQKQVNERLMEVRERYRVLSERLNRIIFWQPFFWAEHGLKRPTLKEQISASKLLAQMDLALFRAELESGAFDDKQAMANQISCNNVLPIGLEERAAVVSRKWKLL